MNGYFFTASTTCAQSQPTNLGRGQIVNEMRVWSGRETFMVCAETLNAAQNVFDEGLAARNQGENPIETKVHEIMVAQLVGELLTETGTVPLDWPQIARQTVTDVQSTPADFLEQGNWLDDSTVNSIKGSGPSMEALRRALPEDISSGLSWAEDKQFFFLFSVLSPSAAPEGPMEDPGIGIVYEPAPVAETTDESQTGQDVEAEAYPKLTPLEAAVLVRARNSAVAVWLWRRYAADTKLAANQILMEGWGGVAGVNIETPPDGN